jgi:hypothetical protein
MKDNDRNTTGQQSKREPACNVSQKYNFTMGGVALLAATVISYLIYRYVTRHS